MRIYAIAVTGLSLISAFHLSWLLLAQADFLYPRWHEVLDIDATVALYGPRNHKRPGFQYTNMNERVRLFAGLAEGVRTGGAGLEQLEYHDTKGKVLQRLLTAPEIEHLKTVANLVHLMESIGWAAVAACGLLLYQMNRVGQAAPPVIKTAALTVTIVSAITGIVLAAGPVKVFYAWHEWFFPPDQTWFFYYEDSLMTMLMKAPDIFAYIGVTWCVLAIMIFVSLLNLARLLTRPDRK